MSETDKLYEKLEQIVETQKIILMHLADIRKSISTSEPVVKLTQDDKKMFKQNKSGAIESLYY